MKTERVVRILFSLANILLIVGCSSVKVLTIEVREPATKPLPSTVSSITIANNSNKQSPDFQNKLVFFNENRADATINADSLGFYACFGLHDALLESGFPSVNILPKAFRNDTLLQPAVPFDHTFTDSICKENQSDALISVDQLLVGSLLNIEEDVPQGFRIARGTFSTQRLSTFRIYIPSDSASPQSIKSSDTLYWDAQEPIVFGELNLNDLLSKLPIGRDAMHEAAYFAGVELAHLIYPHWEKSERCIYTTRNSQMRRAFSLAKKEKWEEAATLWEHISNTKGGKSKAYACANLALYYELNDKFEEAVKWQEKATETIPNAKEEYINYRNYLNILKKRATIPAEKK
ncbi:MAG: DUF6340 family protein [Bacteroidales bacterium]|nr:DUF6340 family protein [Bacteroidales bacterium]MDD4821039.1 DUF6340 family protein [Bacteroidales bacterium]